MTQSQNRSKAIFQKCLISVHVCIHGNFADLRHVLTLKHDLQQLQELQQQQQTTKNK